jgi:hypothetical protein
MAQIQGQAGVNLSADLASYLSQNNGNLTSEQLTGIINNYLTGGDKVASQGGVLSTGVYKRFGEFDTVQGKVETITTGLWTGDTGSLSTFFTSSAQAVAASSEYYLNVYSTDPASDSSAEVQYAVAYGNKYGSGSTSLANDDSSTQATKATYAQYRSILLEEDDNFFSFISASGDSHNSEDIYIINVARARYKETMDPGNMEFILSGSNGTQKFIDDSGKKFSDSVGKAGRVFNIVSGSLNLGTENAATVANKYSTGAANGQGFGLFYPDQGLIVLNPAALEATVGTSIDSGSVGGNNMSKTFTHEGKNQFLLHEMLKGGADFQARRVENVSTSHYFVRAQNREFNFSNNPTFITGSDGSFKESSFETDPRAYITAIGLMNDANEILAVAKTSQPIEKSFDKEVLIKVKLDF